MSKKQIVLFTILLFLIAIICRKFDNLSGDVNSPNISIYVWGISPIIMTLIFRYYNNDWRELGIQLNIRREWKWYLLSVIGIPIICLFKLLISQKVGNIEITQNFSLPLILSSLIGGFGFMFLKNIAEEFTWRGYLTATFNEKGISRIQNHLIVGFIWIAWHLPFLGRGINFSSGNNFWISVLMWTISLLLLSIIYGEIRLKSGTTWTIVLLHTIDNLMTNPMHQYEMIKLLPENKYLVGLGFDNLLNIVLFSIIGWIIYRKK